MPENTPLLSSENLDGFERTASENALVKGELHMDGIPADALRANTDLAGAVADEPWGKEVLE